MRIANCLAVATSTLLTGHALAADTSYKTVHDLAGTLAPLAGAPALDNQRVAFRAIDTHSGIEALYAMKIIGDPATSIVVKRGAEAPSEPRVHLDAISDPAFMAGRVVFGGGVDPARRIGLYAEASPAPATLLDAARMQLPAAPVLASSAALVSGNVIVTAAGDARHFVSDGQAMPGGGDVTRAAAVRPAIESTVVAFAAPLQFRGVAAAGLYAFKTDSHTLSAIIGPESRPPVGDRFLGFRAVDTDAAAVSAIVHTADARGASQYVATFDIATAAAAVLAQVGKPAHLDFVFDEFHSTAIDRGTVYFDATIVRGEDKRYALFAQRGDTRSVLLLSGQVIEGRRVIDAVFSPAGVRDGQIAALVRFDAAPAQPEPAVVIIRPGNPAACTADIDASGSVSVQDVLTYLDHYLSDRPAADLDRSGEIDKVDLYAFLDAYFAGCTGQD